MRIGILVVQATCVPGAGAGPAEWDEEYLPSAGSPAFDHGVRGAGEGWAERAVVGVPFVTPRLPRGVLRADPDPDRHTRNSERALIALRRLSCLPLSPDSKPDSNVRLMIVSNIAVSA